MTIIGRRRDSSFSQLSHNSDNKPAFQPFNTQKQIFTEPLVQKGTMPEPQPKKQSFVEETKQQRDAENLQLLAKFKQ